MLGSLGIWLRKKLLVEHWRMGVIDEPITHAPTWQQCPSVHWLTARDARYYYADPFFVPSISGMILCERYDRVLRHGRIVALSEGNVDEIPINNYRGHASFPFVFKHGGTVFMLPETSAAETTQLLNWDSEKGAWIPYSEILRGRRLADSVIFEHNNYVWLATTDIGVGEHDNLMLYYAKDLKGPWHAHPANPVVKGKERSRNGGAPFESNGRMYRVAQDCSKTYGGSIKIMEIKACTPEGYEEVEVNHILPDPLGECPDGLHTLSPMGAQCLVDGKTMVFLWSELLRKATRRLTGGRGQK